MAEQAYNITRGDVMEKKTRKYDVEIYRDGEASVWIAVCDKIPLVLEDESLDSLKKRTQLAVPELLELNGIFIDEIQFVFGQERLIPHGGL